MTIEHGDEITVHAMSFLSSCSILDRDTGNLTCFIILTQSEIHNR